MSQTKPHPWRHPPPKPVPWRVYLAGLPRGKARTRENHFQTQAPRRAAKDRGEGGVIRGLIYLISPFAPARRFTVAELWRFLVALFIDRFLPFFFWSLQHTLICLATLLPHTTRVRLLLQSAGNMAGRRWGSITTFSVTKWPLNLLQKIRFLFCSIYKHSESSQHIFCCKKIKTIAMQGV